MKKFFINLLRRILRFLYIKWRSLSRCLDMKAFVYVITVSILLVLTTVSMMKSLVQAKSGLDYALEPDRPSEDVRLNDTASQSGSKKGGIVGSIDLEMNSEQQNSSGKKLKITGSDNTNENEENKEKQNDSKKGERIINTAENNPNAIDVLVNKDHKLSEDYVPDNLVTPNVPFAPGSFHKTMRKEAADALEKMFDAASADGISLFAVSGYRSYGIQEIIFNSNVGVKGSVEAANMYSARPGESEHQTGLAMDVTSKSVGYKLIIEFENTAEGKWLSENAHKYGFIVRYLPGKEHITGYAYEPWHIRYLGVELAQAVYESGLTYEEYLQEY